MPVHHVRNWPASITILHYVLDQNRQKQLGGGVRSLCEISAWTGSMTTCFTSWWNTQSELLDFKPKPPPSAQEVCIDSLLCFADERQREFLERSVASPSQNYPCTLPPHYNLELMKRMICLLITYTESSVFILIRVFIKLVIWLCKSELKEVWVYQFVPNLAHAPSTLQCIQNLQIIAM